MGVMAKELDCSLKVSEFKLHSRYYIHFWTNTLGNSMNPLVLTTAIGKIVHLGKDSFGIK